MLTGCDRLDMYDQPRYKPLAASDFFTDGLSARPLEPGTIPRGGLHDDEAFYLGKEEGRLVSQIPAAALKAVYDRDFRRSGQSFEEVDAVELRRALIMRGRERYEIFCAVCHGRTGDGTGMIVRRGFRAPPSYHIDRLREAPAGHYFDVMTNGFGAMASYANRIEVADRWAIVAYIRALQLSQNAPLDDVPDDERNKLEPVEQEAPP
jgi:mono/diheme cytochrome c family protein